MIAPRIVAAETLDYLAHDDPAALRSRRDLVRVHRAMGTRSIMSSGWKELISTDRSNAPLRILEIGAGDGTLLLGVARTLSRHWPPVQLTLLDRLDIVSPATLAAYEELGWSVRVELIDVLDWAGQDQCSLPSKAFRKWDLITTTLFLHHFESMQLSRVLTKVAACADRFFACEPKRSWLALLSVRAGFRAAEISAHWPQSIDDQWQLREFNAGLFSHCFSAHRAGADQ